MLQRKKKINTHKDSHRNWETHENLIMILVGTLTRYLYRVGKNIFSVGVILRTLYNTFMLSLRFCYSISLQEYRWGTMDYIRAGFSPVKMAFDRIKIQTEPLQSKVIASLTRLGLLRALYHVFIRKKLYNSISSRFYEWWVLWETQEYQHQTGDGKKKKPGTKPQNNTPVEDHSRNEIH